MFRRAGESAVKIDDMKFPAALAHPVRRLSRWIVAVHRNVIFASLTQTHAFAALEIDSW